MPTSLLNEELEAVRCPICQVDDCEIIYPSRRSSLAVRQDEFRASGDTPLEDPLVRCQRCSMQYVNPRVPTHVVLEGYASAVDEAFTSQAEGRTLTFERNLRAIQSVWRKPPGRLLDIGAANGVFLHVAQQAGWRVEGCEPNRWMCRWCEEHYQITLTPGTVFDGRYAAGAFDVVTLWDVLEHTPDPLAVLRECERLLAPGGLLVINYPDIGSWIARLMGRRWVFLISVHHYYFTRRTCRALLDMVGLRTLVMKPHIQTLALDYILFRAEALLDWVARVPRRAAQRLRLGSLQVPYWMGQTLVVACRKGE